MLVKNLCKSFDDVKAVDNVSFEIEESSIFVLLGHNGAGKTTLLQMLTGNCEADTGSVQVFGRKIIADKLNAEDLEKNLNALRKCLGVCPQ